jgi:putative ABC transport system permease protein
MKTRYLIQKSGRSMRQHKSRTLLTSLGVAISAFVLTIAMAGGEGIRHYSDQLVSKNINPRVVFIAKDKDVVELGNNQGASMTKYKQDGVYTRQGELVHQMKSDDIAKLRNNPDLEKVQPRPNINVDYLTFGDSGEKYVAPVSIYDATIRYNVVAGELPPVGFEIEKNEAAVPLRYAELLVQDGVIKTTESLIGKKITLTVSNVSSLMDLTDAQIRQAAMSGGLEGLKRLAKPSTKQATLTVRALTEKLTSASNRLNGVIQISPSVMMELDSFTEKGTPGEDKYTLVSAIVKPNLDVQKVAEKLEQSGYPTATAKELQSQLFSIVGILEFVALGLGGLVLIASLFGIANTQYISVLERTRQIGLMKALGMRNRDVARLFRYEAAWIGLIGGAMGVIAAQIFILFANPFIRYQLELVEGEKLLIPQIDDTLLILVGLIIVATIAGYLPARRASRMNPIQALRME